MKNILTIVLATALSIGGAAGVSSVMQEEPEAAVVEEKLVSATEAKADIVALPEDTVGMLEQKYVCDITECRRADEHSHNEHNQEKVSGHHRNREKKHH